MTTDVSAALATLQLHPEDSQALKALAAVHPGNGAGIDADVAVARRCPTRAASTANGATSSSVVSLIDLELAWTTARRAPRRPASREGAACCSTSCCATRPARPPCARRWRRTRARGRRRSRWRRCRWCAPTGSRSRSDTCSRRRARRIRRWRPASTGRSPSSTSSTGPADGEGETYLRKSLELDPHNRRSGDHFERLLREKGNNEELLTLYTQRADRAANRDERALAEVAAAELCDKMDRAGRRLHALPQGARREPERAARAAAGARGAVAPARSGRSWARCWRPRRAASAASRTSRC